MSIDNEQHYIVSLQKNISVREQNILCDTCDTRRAQQACINNQCSNCCENKNCSFHESEREINRKHNMLHCPCKKDTIRKMCTNKLCDDCCNDNCCVVHGGNNFCRKCHNLICKWGNFFRTKCIDNICVDCCDKSNCPRHGRSIRKNQENIIALRTSLSRKFCEKQNVRGQLRREQNVGDVVNIINISEIATELICSKCGETSDILFDGENNNHRNYKCDGCEIEYCNKCEPYHQYVIKCDGDECKHHEHGLCHNNVTEIGVYCSECFDQNVCKKLYNGTCDVCNTVLSEMDQYNKNNFWNCNGCKRIICTNCDRITGHYEYKYSSAKREQIQEYCGKCLSSKYLSNGILIDDFANKYSNISNKIVNYVENNDSYFCLTCITCKKTKITKRGIRDKGDDEIETIIANKRADRKRNKNMEKNGDCDGDNDSDDSNESDDDIVDHKIKEENDYTYKCNGCGNIYCTTCNPCRHYGRAHWMKSETDKCYGDGCHCDKCFDPNLYNKIFYNTCGLCEKILFYPEVAQWDCAGKCRRSFCSDCEITIKYHQIIHECKYAQCDFCVAGNCMNNHVDKYCADCHFSNARNKFDGNIVQIFRYIKNKQYEYLGDELDMKIKLVDEFKFVFNRDVPLINSLLDDGSDFEPKNQVSSGNRDSYECQICYNNANCQIVCGHLFCLECFIKHKLHGSTTCPTCRSKINKKIVIRN